LSERVLPDSIAIDLAGVLLTAAGIGVAIWARRYLGANWSVTPIVKRGHTLVQSGPYALVRHPIYSGCLLALFGSAAVAGEGRGFLGCALAFLVWWRKSKVEEELMRQEFGGGYDRYRARVKALIPFVL
jgi:protein-S-isoprenylcysteine O-methyltransferase Ste14